MRDFRKKQKKDGMQLEKNVVKRYNEVLGKKKEKKFNIKERMSFTDDDLYEEEVEEVPSDVNPINANNLFRDTNPERKTFSEIKYDGKSKVGRGKVNEAKQTPNSGAFWSAKGDVSVEHALMEVKHRGTYTTKGKASISIQRDWLEKQRKEAIFEGKDYWYLPFGYKDFDEIYLVKDFDDELEHIKILRDLYDENDKLKEEIEKLKKENKKLKENTHGK